MKINREEFLKYYNMGYNDRQIAEAIGCSQIGVLALRHRSGLKKNYKSRPSSLDLSKFIEYYNLGLVDREIAELTGCTLACVGYNRRELGLQAHNPNKHKDLREIPLRLSDSTLGSLLEDYTPSDEDKPWTDPESLFCDGEFLEKIKSKVVEESP